MNGTTSVLRKRTWRKHIDPQRVKDIIFTQKRKWDRDIFWRRKGKNKQPPRPPKKNQNPKTQKTAMPEYGARWNWENWQIT